jgi:hypothetical protein
MILVNKGSNREVLSWDRFQVNLSQHSTVKSRGEGQTMRTRERERERVARREMTC